MSPAFYAYNVGESNADSFNVKVEVINEDNSRQTIFTQQLIHLILMEESYLNCSHTSLGSGAKIFQISIVPKTR